MTQPTPSRRLQFTLQPSLLRWARKRVNLSPESLAEKPYVKPDRVTQWEQSGKISIAQADRLAARTFTPLGYLYLEEPPDDSLTIRDFRTQAGHPPRCPSPNLLDTICQTQRRQAWLRDDLIENQEDPLPFVDAYTHRDDHTAVASAMRHALGLNSGWAEEQWSWRQTLSFLRNRVDQAGILLVFNGVVGNSNRRKIDPKELLGFALVDEYAPLVFVNSAYYIAAQTFTLAHELAHLFVGETGLSALDKLMPANNETEQFCNRTAADILVPAEELRALWPTVRNRKNPYQKIALRVRVSAIVAARRLFDLELIERESFLAFYAKNKTQGKGHTTTSSSGTFWKGLISQTKQAVFCYGAGKGLLLGTLTLPGSLSYCHSKPGAFVLTLNAALATVDGSASIGPAISRGVHTRFGFFFALVIVVSEHCLTDLSSRVLFIQKMSISAALPLVRGVMG